MAYFTQDFLTFFKDLSANNDREWFNANKMRFKKQLEQPFLKFLEVMIAPAGTTSSNSEPKQELTEAQKDSLAKVEQVKLIEERKNATDKATDLVTMCVENEVNADNQVKGKKFYVEGRIGDIGKDILDDICVTLESGDVIRTVQCYIGNNDLVAKLQKGQRITVFGKCESLMMNVLMKDCAVVPNLADLEKQQYKSSTE